MTQRELALAMLPRSTRIIDMCRAAIVLLLTVFWPLAALSGKAAQRDTGDLTLGHVHVDWPTPETLIKELRSTDDQVRLKALELLGVRESKVPVPADPKTGSPATVIVKEVEESELRYATLGPGDDQQAIVAANIGSDLYGAVVVQTPKGWQRIANFYCWCRYEDGDLLAGFIQVEYADSAYELVVHASGGGTGLYAQSEFRFRIHHGELKTVLSFTNQYRECRYAVSGKGSCDGERRWFREGVDGGVLVESKFGFPIAEEGYSISQLELLHAQPPRCTAYRWDAKAFQYAPSSASHRCREDETLK
jgi:hypothetical protein